MKLHQKGFLLVELSKVESVWDLVLIHKALQEYHLKGEYWENHFRVAFDELAAAGLIKRLEARLVTVHSKAVLSFHYQLTEFGRARMLDTGLLPEGIEA